MRKGKLKTLIEAQRDSERPGLCRPNTNQKTNRLNDYYCRDSAAPDVAALPYETFPNSYMNRSNKDI